MPALLIEKYQVGVVCALPKEMTAARAILDEEHEKIESQDALDHNNYVLGRVHTHNVVIACLPAGVYGNNAAAIVANNMLRTFTGLRFGLMVGIGGGIPNLEKSLDIRLGDVVVSQPDKTHGGVVQYDLGKNLGEGKFERKGFLRPPPTLLLTALATLQSQHDLDGSQIPTLLSQMIQRRPNLAKTGYVSPGSEKDCLNCAQCGNLERDSSCKLCKHGKIQREARSDQSPVVHYGVIASGNQLIKDAVERDKLGREFGALCVEMEAAGLINEFPCLVIRGICDYADSHKNDAWQKYAATTAAAYAKELLSVITSANVAEISPATDVVQKPKYDRGLNLFDTPDVADGLFIGRDTELEQMENILLSSSNHSTRKVLILGGMGGIGKTQLAINYAKRHCTSYSSVFWLNATSESTLNSSLRDVANRILPPEAVSKLDDDQLRIQVSNWLSELDNTRWLLILDNYDDPDQYNLTKYYPSVAHGSIIIATRQPRRINGEQVKVESMTEANDSLAILATRSGRQAIQSDPGARQLAQRLDGFPLALATAGAFLKESSISFFEYLQQYEAKWEVVLDDKEELPDYPTRTLYTTWDLSLTQIKQQNAQAAKLLAFLAYFDHQDIWYELLRAGQGADRPAWFTELISDKFSLESAMRTLTRYCLVESHGQTGSYSLHVCVHDWTLDGLNYNIDSSQYWLAFDCVANHVRLEGWDNLSALRYRRLTPHAVRLAHTRFQRVGGQHEWLQERLTGAQVIGQLLYQQIQYKAAERMYLRVLDGSEKALGPDHTSTLRVVNNLGLLYGDQGKLAEAEQMYVRALAGKEKVLGPDHTSTLGTVNNLGSLYRDQGKLAEAEQMYVRALAGYEKALGPAHTSTLSTVHNLGNLYGDQGKLAEAEQMLVRALAGRKKALGPDHTETLSTVNNLGNLYRGQGKLAEAEQMLVRALAGREKGLGPDHTSTLLVVVNSGSLFCYQGRLAEAEQMYQRALTGMDNALGSEHMWTLGTMNNLGNLHCEKDQPDRAEQMYHQALSGMEMALGPDHTFVLGIVNNLGVLYADRGLLVESKQMYRRALDGLQPRLGSDHPTTGMVIRNLERLQKEAGKDQTTSVSKATGHRPRRRWYFW